MGSKQSAAVVARQAEEVGINRIINFSMPHRAKPRALP